MNSEQLSINAECDIIGSIENKSKQTPSNDIIERKTCPKCKQTLPPNMFNRRNRNTFMLKCYCKSCEPLILRDWRLKNLEKIKQKEKVYRNNIVGTNKVNADGMSLYRNRLGFGKK